LSQSRCVWRGGGAFGCGAPAVDPAPVDPMPRLGQLFCAGWQRLLAVVGLGRGWQGRASRGGRFGRGRWGAGAAGGGGAGVVVAGAARAAAVLSALLLAELLAAGLLAELPLPPLPAPAGPHGPHQDQHQAGGGGGAAQERRGTCAAAAAAPACCSCCNAAGWPRHPQLLLDTAPSALHCHSPPSSSPHPHSHHPPPHHHHQPPQMDLDWSFQLKSGLPSITPQALIPGGSVEISHENLFGDSQSLTVSLSSSDWRFPAQDLGFQCSYSEPFYRPNTTRNVQVGAELPSCWGQRCAAARRGLRVQVWRGAGSRGARKQAAQCPASRQPQPGRLGTARRPEVRPYWEIWVLQGADWPSAAACTRTHTHTHTPSPARCSTRARPRPSSRRAPSRRSRPCSSTALAPRPGPPTRAATTTSLRARCCCRRCAPASRRPDRAAAAVAAGGLARRCVWWRRRVCPMAPLQLDHGASRLACMDGGSCTPSLPWPHHLHPCQPQPSPPPWPPGR
jgi:hypothetical protein